MVDITKLTETINDFKAKSIQEQYQTLVKITSPYYNIEINGIHIEEINFDEYGLRIITPNNRKIDLKIVDDLEIHFLKE